ncbi:hypothetical protein SAMN02910447_03616 [Ruminococcus sp. YE71]|nr:hypothetical protein SAMN02910446_03728 [Ruminococcus sp. YE78]SFW54484.1 hypothetical protein SAMN02910447_03616 [Ruminococcus sp. YE71]
MTAIQIVPYGTKAESLAGVQRATSGALTNDVRSLYKCALRG